MKLFSGLLSALVLAAVICFALSNQSMAVVGMWPLSGTMEMPLYLVGLVPLAAGLFVGGLVGWLRGLPHRLKARRLHKELGALNERIGELQKAAVTEPDLPPPQRPFWKRKI
ncbi:MAG: LapA family protein [Alphaproteobacteria bacterium]|nr:LapA family protein [Alphaproteobacteria bacterium]